MSDEISTIPVQVKKPTITNEIFPVAIAIMWPDGTWSARILSKEDLRNSWMFSGHYLPRRIAFYLFPQFQQMNSPYRTIDESEEV